MNEDTSRRAACSSLPDGPVAEERAAFEKAWLEHMGGNPAWIARADLNAQNDRLTYCERRTRDGLAGWQARASLSAVSLPDGGAAEREALQELMMDAAIKHGNFRFAMGEARARGEHIAAELCSDRATAALAEIPAAFRTEASTTIRNSRTAFDDAAPSAQPPVPEVAKRPDKDAFFDGGWAWMTHPDRNIGNPFPVYQYEAEGTRYYVPLDPSERHELVWDERDEEWEMVRAPMEAVAIDDLLEALRYRVRYWRQDDPGTHRGSADEFARELEQAIAAIGRFA